MSIIDMGFFIKEVQMKFHDLKEKSSNKPTEVEKDYYPGLYLNQKQIPELVDFGLGDSVEFHIVAKVTSESKREGEDKSLSLEMRKAAIINLKPDRVEAEEKGLSVEQIKELNASRRKK